MLPLGFRFQDQGYSQVILWYSYLYLNFFSCVWCVCVSVCVHVCMHSCTLWHMCVGQSGTTSVWVSLPRSWGRVCCSSLLWPESFWRLMPLPHLILAALELQMHLLWYQFHLGSEMPKSSPHTCMSSISPTEPSPQPRPQLCVCMGIHRTWEHSISY